MIPRRTLLPLLFAGAFACGAEAPLPLQLEESFDATPAGEVPRGAHVRQGGGSGKVRVTTESPRAGVHCLKITDGPDVSAAEYPRFHYVTGHRTGVTRVTFAVRTVPGVAVVHEWRDNAQPPRIGPVVRIENGWITSMGQRLAPMPDGEWVRVELEMRLGENSRGSFDLVIRLPGEPAERLRELPFADAGVRQIDWIGFSTVSTAPAAWWLDELQIKNLSPAEKLPLEQAEAEEPEC
jgi:hypothetical protein